MLERLAAAANAHGSAAATERARRAERDAWWGDNIKHGFNSPTCESGEQGEAEQERDQELDQEQEQWGTAPQ